MAVITTQRNVHLDCLATSTALSAFYLKNFVPPLEVTRVLSAAHVRFMLVGAHAIGGWHDEARATQGVDVVVGFRQHQKPTRALLAAYPQLVVDDQEVVVRLSDPETGKVVFDEMNANQSLVRQAFKHTRAITAEGNRTEFHH
jgi:hypothetical protein